MSVLLRGLGRQLVLSMIAATVASVLFAITIFYLFYGLLMQLAPGMIPFIDNSLMPSRIEWILIAALCFAAAGFGTFIAVGLARRIVAPLVSVAESARRMADGDLTVRAVPADSSLSEAAILVHDFNLLADRVESASDAISRWNATIAHELRTPVTILSGRLQGLVDGVFAPDAPLLRSLVSQTESLARLIEDLRTVSLFEGGRLSISIDRVQLHEEIASAVSLMQPRLESAGFPLFVSLDPGLCDVDAARLRQALLALLENVRRHADPAPVKVRLAIDATSLMLSVTDGGPGLPPAFARYAFEPFRQYMEESEGPKGSGLGLAVVRAIAEAHGGVATYRAEDDGACFAITIPRYQDADATNNASATAAP